MNTLKNHSGLITGVLMLVYAVLSVYLGKQTPTASIPDVIGGLGLLGLHFAD